MVGVGELHIGLYKKEKGNYLFDTETDQSFVFSTKNFELLYLASN